VACPVLPGARAGWPRSCLPEADEQIRTAEAALDAIEQPVREAANRQAVSSTQATQSDSVRQKPINRPGQPKQPRRPRRRSLVGPIVAVLVALVVPSW
jgi:hypothetical protein